MMLLSAATAAATMGVGAQSLWEVLGAAESPTKAWSRVFGEYGERGEYMDGYSKEAMITRCIEDYKWDKTFEDLLEERSNMMSHLYDNEELWKQTCMVAFADHYVLNEDRSFCTFSKHKGSQPEDQPIFGGVVWSDWETTGSDNEALPLFSKAGIDYVRLECNFGTDEDIGGAANLSRSQHRDRFGRLAKAVKACQDHKMVPLMLLQFPWRDPNISKDYFRVAVTEFATAMKEAGVETNRILLETRPPIGMSAQEERGLTGTQKVALGYSIGESMFRFLHKAFEDTGIVGFCVAGGSTKGDNPTAMEDDTQNAVRQGMRECARQQWNYDLCFWEMGAKLMLQPKVGRLWGRNSQAGRDAARELFSLNAEDLGEEIRTKLEP